MVLLPRLRLASQLVQRVSAIESRIAPAFFKLVGWTYLCSVLSFQISRVPITSVLFDVEQFVDRGPR